MSRHLAMAMTTLPQPRVARGTLAYGEARPSAKRDPAPSPSVSVANADTLQAPASKAAASAPQAAAIAAQVTLTPFRATVLPRTKGDAAELDVVARYEHVRALGEGGVGEVALERDRDIERTVAVKRLHPHLASDTTLARFAEEVRTVGSLEHPSIVPIHDVGIDEEGRHYFTMKYVDGETLESVIDKMAAGDEATIARFPFERCASLYLQIAKAISYAHAQGFIHRDIKPSNIMIGRYGEVTIMDWGLAKRVAAPIAPPDAPIAAKKFGVDILMQIRKDKPLQDARRARMNAVAPPALVAAFVPPSTGDLPLRAIETQVGQLLGTPAYMSPEQARGDNDQVDKRSDVYALSVVFHELLTRRHYLSSAKTLHELLDGIQTFDRWQLGAEWMKLGIPHEYLEVVARGLAHDPDQRWQSADEIVAALEAIQCGEMCVVCPFTATKRVLHAYMKWIERWPRVFLASITLTVFSLLGGAGLGIYALVHALTG